MNVSTLSPRAEPATFHDLMAEQLRHAPWLVLSTLMHVLALLLLWLLMPPEVQRAVQHAVAVADLDVPPPVVEPPRVEPIEPVPERTDTIVPVLDEVRAPEVQEVAADSDALADTAGDTTGTLSAFASNQSNPAVGLGPGAGGKGGQRGRGNRGGTPGVPNATIDASLQWLAHHQDADGKWDCDGFMKHDVPERGAPCDGPGNPVHDVGVTALALLAFLGDGSTLRTGPYRANVRAAVVWLRDQQRHDGLFGQASSSDFVYDHAIAAYAMTEAYGLSGYHTLQAPAQRGIDYLQAHRNPYGAWRYQPRSGDDDASVTCWCIMALASAQHWGLAVDTNALRLAATYLDGLTGADGHCGYQHQGQLGARKAGDHAVRFPPDRTDALTAAALFCRFFLGQDPRETPCMPKATERLRARRPVWDPKTGTIDFYYWYYASYALHQVGGQPWKEWCRALDAAVVRTQRADGNTKGSWDPIDVWGEDGGRVYATAMLCLTMEAYYRYTRLAPR